MILFLEQKRVRIKCWVCGKEFQGLKWSRYCGPKCKAAAAEKRAK